MKFLLVEKERKKLIEFSIGGEGKRNEVLISAEIKMMMNFEIFFVTIHMYLHTSNTH